ncbi:PilZ domain-containing protein [Desulfobotulus mexicanus]|uniref:PilZ domain-containing protein n=1 Tax=Desulfobotulus mexicanus TaxID=2586642 RepID=A0A5Q4VDF8_9BACT|nr:PilZ domain-containing protein [Desulfobotulus mexicanus]TYT74988.1 PilZ domain-containing protein [Desulfobotulus mexicanus]
MEKYKKPEKDNLANVTQRLVHHILGMSYDERRDLLLRLESGDVEKQQEKRKGPRIPYLAEVDFVVEERAYRGMILDISEDGARIAACDIPPAGAEVRMAFPLPGSRTAHVRMTGLVVRDADMDFGVAFNRGLNPDLQRYDIKILGPHDLKKNFPES